MPSNFKTAFLGFTTLRILDGVPPEQAGYLIKALARWILEKKEPEASEIPAECLGAWIAVREASVAIAERKKELAAYGRSGGRPARKTPENEPEAESAESRAKPGASQGKPRKAKAKPGASQGKQDEDEDIYTSDKSDVFEEGAAGGGASVRRTSVETEGGFSVDPSDDFMAWAATVKDPVEIALRVTGEERHGRARRTYGAALKTLGRERFVEEVNQFRAELDAGESVRNRGAALTKRLAERARAMAAVAATAGGAK